MATSLMQRRLSGNLDSRVVVYCTQAPSARSILAAETLTKLGYTNVVALEGGLGSWEEAALPVVVKEGR